MAKFHINAKGEPGVCHAQQKCPLGSNDQHFSTADDARKAYELVMDVGGKWKPHTKKVQSEYDDTAITFESTSSAFTRTPLTTLVSISVGQPNNMLSTRDPYGDALRDPEIATLLEELATAVNRDRPYGFPEDEQTCYYQDQAEREIRRKLEEKLGISAPFVEISHVVTQEDREYALNLMVERLPTRDEKYSWDSVMGPGARVTKNNRARYQNALRAVAQNNTMLQAEVDQLARSHRDTQVYARAFMRGLPVPQEAHNEFEKVWTGGIDQLGSESDLHHQLRELGSLESRYREGQLRPSKIVGGGLRDSRKAADSFFVQERDELFTALKTHGRSYPTTVRNVRTRLMGVHS